MASNPPAQTAFTPGYSVGAADMLAIVGGIGWLTGNPPTGYSRRPTFYLVQTVAQSLSSGTSTPLLFDTEVYDTDSGHSTTSNTSRYTVNTAGLYVMISMGGFASNANNARKVWYQTNGVTANAYWGVQQGASPSFGTGVQSIGLLPLNAGDYVELMGWQNSGGVLNTDVTSSTYGSRFAGVMISTL